MLAESELVVVGRPFDVEGVEEDARGKVLVRVQTVVIGSLEEDVLAIPNAGFRDLDGLAVVRELAHTPTLHEGAQTLLFLRARSDGSGYVPFGSRSGVRVLSNVELEDYLEFIARLLAVSGEHELDLRRQKTVEVLVDMAENPHLVHDAIHDLDDQHKPADWYAIEGCSSALEPRHVSRLMALLCERQATDYTAVGLSNILAGWDHPRIVPCLATHLRRVDHEVPYEISWLMADLSRRLNDPELQALYDQFDALEVRDWMADRESPVFEAFVARLEVVLADG
jgi:hypothetical protein